MLNEKYESKLVKEEHTNRDVDLYSEEKYRILNKDYYKELKV